jgi:hypothetical protein
MRPTPTLACLRAIKKKCKGERTTTRVALRARVWVWVWVCV